MNASTKTHRDTLTFMADELEKPPPWLDSGAALVRRAALEWALDQTQEPAPPPGGWPDWLPKPKDCIEIITLAQIAAEQLIDAECRRIQKPDVSFPPPTYLKVATEWALPILRRAANLSQELAPGVAVSPDTTRHRLSLMGLLDDKTLDREAKKSVAWALRMTEPDAAPPAGLGLSTAKINPPKTDLQALAALAKREIRFWEEAAEVSGKVTGKAALRAIRGFKTVLRYLDPPAAANSN